MSSATSPTPSPSEGPDRGATRRILLRAHRDLTKRSTPSRVARLNQIGNNSGNLIFAHGVARALSVPTAEITADRGRVDPTDAERINAEYDQYVVPLANAFRRSFADRLDRYSALIERLTIPVVVVGVGTQLNAAGTNRDSLDPIVPSVHRFMRAVLQRSASVGVRGETTYEFLRELGYSDTEVTVIGCPSLFQFGPTLRLDEPAALDLDSRISMNVSPYVKLMAPIAASHTQRYSNLQYVAQDLATLRTLLTRTDPPDADRFAPGIPYRVTDELLANGQTRFFIDPTSWIDQLRTQDLSFGTRIHGNIAALLAGTPAVVLAHDSRTVELAQYHQIPYRLITDVDPAIDASQLYAEADYSNFHSNQQSRFQTYLRFLELNDVQHIFSDDAGAVESVDSFDRAVASARTEGSVTMQPRRKRAFQRMTARLR